MGGGGHILVTQFINSRVDMVTMLKYFNMPGFLNGASWATKKNSGYLKAGRQSKKNHQGAEH